jgi:hypothetical protein
VAGTRTTVACCTGGPVIVSPGATARTTTVASRHPACAGPLTRPTTSGGHRRSILPTSRAPESNRSHVQSAQRVLLCLDARLGSILSNRRTWRSTRPSATGISALCRSSRPAISARTIPPSSARSGESSRNMRSAEVASLDRLSCRSTVFASDRPSHSALTGYLRAQPAFSSLTRPDIIMQSECTKPNPAATADFRFPMVR